MPEIVHPIDSFQLPIDVKLAEYDQINSLTGIGWSKKNDIPHNEIHVKG